MKEFLQITEQDNVVVALKDFKKDEVIHINGTDIKLLNDVPRGHKIAIKNINKGETVVKYGFSIGIAKEDITVGEHVHTHNLRTGLEGMQTYAYNRKTNTLEIPNRNLTFKGYRRENGEVGIRNELWIVPTVGCVNAISDTIIETFKREVNPEGIDAIEVYKHNYGCSQLGDDHMNTRTILQDIVKHPNAGGVLVFSLGCENNTLDEFRESLGDYNANRVRFLQAQQVEDEVEAGVAYLKELYEVMKKDKREDIPLSELRVGLKCGGSDGFSGITANPLIGAFSDFLIAQGGTTVLTEVPEMFGAETILMERAENEEVFENVVHLINDFKEYFTSHNQPIYENPSPGNKAGGITTLEEKSLGCTQKGGKATVVDVLKYGERIRKHGLNLLSAPGNDLVSCTAMASSGAHMILFSTGRGTPFGTFVPTVKISTNSQIYNKKRHWIDFNAGGLVEDKTIDELLEELIQYVISVASGERTNNEKGHFKEIAIFKSGVTL